MKRGFEERFWPLMRSSKVGSGAYLSTTLNPETQPIFVAELARRVLAGDQADEPFFLKLRQLYVYERQTAVPMRDSSTKVSVESSMARPWRPLAGRM